MQCSYIQVCWMNFDIIFHFQVHTILQEHTKQGEVTLLIYRGGKWLYIIYFLEAMIFITALLPLNRIFSLHPSLAIYHSAISPGSVRRLPPPLLRPPPPPVGSDNSSVFPEVLPMPRTSISTPPSPAPTRSSLIQSTSFLESIPVTLTMDPKEWLNTGLEDEAGAVTVSNTGLERQGGDHSRRFRGFDVELRRKPGEGFGFVIASQDVENGKGKKSCLASTLLFSTAHFFKGSTFDNKVDR